MNISHYKNYHSFGEIKSIKLRFSPYFCKPVVKNGLKTWLNIDLSISTLCLCDRFNVVILLLRFIR